MLGASFMIHLGQHNHNIPVALAVLGSIWLTGIIAILWVNRNMKQLANAQAQAAANAQEQRLLAESLADIAIALNSTLELDEVMSRLLVQVERVVPSDTANIMLCDGDSARIVHTRGYTETNQASNDFALQFPIHNIPSFQQMMASKRPYMVADTQADPDWHLDIRAYAPRSYVGAPMVVEGEIIGFLNLNSETPGFFTTEQAEQLDMFAALAATAIRNAQLYEQLRESETKFKALAEQSPNIIFISQNGRIVYTNARAVAELGYTKEELYAPSFDPLTLVDQNSRKLLLQNFQEYQAGRDVAPCEYHLISKDGQHKDVMISTKLMNLAGEPAIFGIITDITAFKQTELELERRLQQQDAVARLGQQALAAKDLSLLLDDAALLVAQVLDVPFCKILTSRPDGEALLLQAGVGWQAGLVGEALVGIGRDSQAGYTLLSDEPVIVTDLARDPRFSGPPLLTEHGVISGISTTIPGRERPFGVLGAHTNTYRQFTQDDVNFLQSVAHILAETVTRQETEADLYQHIHYLKLLNDITQTGASAINLPEMLQLLADRLGELFDADGCYISLWDAEKNRPMPVASYGPLRQTYASLKPLPGEPTMTESVLQAGRPLAVEDVLHTPYLSRRIAEMFPTRSMLGLPLIAGGEKLGVALISYHHPRHFTEEDIAKGKQSATQIALAVARVQLLDEVQNQAALLEQRVAERTAELEAVLQELRQTQEQLVEREKLAVLGRLAGGVAHELRNPLGAMRNATYALSMLLDAANTNVTNLIEVLNDEIEVSVGIITSLLEYTHRRPPLIRSIDVHELINHAVEELNAPAEIDVIYQIDDSLPPALGDPAHLLKILHNLGQNAVQAMSPPYAAQANGRLTIQAVVTETDHIAISFSDTGIGFPMENKDKLFEPLFSTKAKGIGLGLPLVKAMLEDMNGRIEATGQPGKGATFTIYIPVSENPSGQSETR